MKFIGVFMGVVWFCSIGFASEQRPTIQCKNTFGTQFEEFLATANETIGINHIHSSHRSGALRFLNTAQYTSAVKKEKLLPTDILVLEEIDPSLDLPFVSGVIISRALPPGRTHLDEMAEKLDIPFVHIPGIYEASKHLHEKLDRRIISLNSQETPILKINASQLKIPRTYLKSVLPRTNPNEELRIYRPEEGLKESISIVGEKFKWMAALQKAVGKESTPNFVSIGSGLYYQFLSTPIPGAKQSLREYIKEKIEEIVISQNVELAHKNLEDIRNTMKIVARSPISQAKELFTVIYDQLMAFYGNETILYKRFSVRSNNSIEDLIGAGLYASNSSKIDNLKNFVDAILKVWLSSFSPRAYFTRTYFGTQEENHNMPIMIHPFLDRQFAHGLMEFRPHELEEYIATGQLVLGEKERSTNPSRYSSVLPFEIINDGFDSGAVVEFKNVYGNHREMIKPLHKAHSVLLDATNNLKSLDSAMSDVWNFEFMLQKNKEGELELKILQVKNKLYQDQVHSILKGELSRDHFTEKSGKNIPKNELPSWIEIQLNNSGLITIDKFLKEKNENSQLKGRVLDYARFIMIEVNHKTYFVLSNIPDRFIHASMWKISKQQLPGLDVHLKNTGLVSVDLSSKKPKIHISKPNEHRFGSSIWFKNIFLKTRIHKQVKDALKRINN